MVNYINYSVIKDEKAGKDPLFKQMRYQTKEMKWHAIIQQ